MKKILLAVQFSRFDQPQAMALARLMADLEPGKSTRADLLFSFRPGMIQDADSILYCARKFQTFTLTGKQLGSGWPVGCNTQMFETYQHYCSMTARGKWDYAAMMLIEPDCVPLRPTWIKELQEEWHEGNQLVLGPWQGFEDAGIEHINGNLMISHLFLRKVRNFLACSPKWGWDTEFAPQLLAHGRASRLIWSDYKLGSEVNPWRGCDFLFAPKKYRDPRHPLLGQDLQPCWFHGIKTMKGLECIREKLLS